jgi:hypothetical protein
MDAVYHPIHSFSFNKARERFCSRVNRIKELTGISLPSP